MTVLCGLSRHYWQLFLARIGMDRLQPGEAIADCEPLLLDHLEEWMVGTTWLDGVLESTAGDEVRQRLVRSGLIPGGRRGEGVSPRGRCRSP